MRLFNHENKKERKEQKKMFDAFSKRLPEIKKAFLQFQIDHDVRCAIVNEFQGTEGYPPNLIIDLLLQNNRISWRPFEAQEKERILQVINKKEEDIKKAEEPAA